MCFAMFGNVLCDLGFEDLSLCVGCCFCVGVVMCTLMCIYSDEEVCIGRVCE